MERAALGEAFHGLPKRFCTLPEAVEEEALEVARHLDIHGGADGEFHVAPGVAPRIEEHGKDVVFVRGQDELGDR